VIELVLAHGMDEGLDGELVREFAAYEASVLDSARRGDRAQVSRAEAAVSADPSASFSFDGSGSAPLTVAGRTSRDLDVVVNGRNIRELVELDTIIDAVRNRGGVLLSCPRGGPVSIHR
jgi:NAD(P)-dependent dehydrogenase (short-subunit alcohol dehydrogenase family)